MKWNKLNIQSNFQGDIDVLFENLPSEIGHPFSPHIVVQKNVVCAKMPRFSNLNTTDE